IQLRPLRLDLDLIRVRAVSLSDVEELFGDADGFAGDANQFSARLDASLRPQRFVKEHPHSVQNSIALRDRLLLSQDLFLGEDAPALAELPAEQNGLLDKGKMLALLAESARAELFTCISDDRVWPETRLNAAAFGSADRSLRFRQCRISLQRHSLQVGSGQDLLAGGVLTPSARRPLVFGPLFVQTAPGPLYSSLILAVWRILGFFLRFTSRQF